jgi:hypothetical protein
MNPPLREAADRDALIEGLRDGSIDVIATDHAPHHADEKALEFDRAPFGIVGLETAVSLCFDRLVHPGVVSLPRLVELLSAGPARVLGVPGGTLVEGGPADITILAPDATVTVRASALRSKSKNTPSGWTPRRARGHDRRRPRLPSSMRTPDSEPSVRHNPRPQALTNLQRTRCSCSTGTSTTATASTAAYLNPHRIFRQPSLIWRFAQTDRHPAGIDQRDRRRRRAGDGRRAAGAHHCGLLDGRRSLDASARELRAALAMPAPSTCGRSIEGRARSAGASSPTTFATPARRSARKR